MIPDRMTQVDTELTQAALDCARTAFGGASIVATTTLRDSPGWSVERLALVTGTGARTVIAKTARARERAALEVLTDANVPAVPRLLAACDGPSLVLIEDAGTGASVADHLMGDDPDEATAAVQRWAEAVARVQAATLGMGMDFRSRLAALTATAQPDRGTDVYRDRLGPQRAVGWKVAVTQPASDMVIIDAFDGLRDGLAPLGETADPDALAELRAIAGRLSADSADVRGPGALTPCDGCPDNNVETPGGLVLIDFESADFRHVAWDAAYLTVPWPTCWCSWRMPNAVERSALARWRTTIEPELAPAVAATLGDAIRDATVGWALITAGWFLSAAHRDQPLGPGGSMRPGPRMLVQHRLGVAAAADPYGVLGGLAASALSATRAAWGDCPLLLSPAWR
jgi:hypothetical protein